MLQAAERPRYEHREAAGGGGRRMAAAFEAAAALPAQSEARRRLLAACDRPAPSADELAEPIECDPALAIAVIRAAGDACGDGGPGGVPEAVEALGVEAVRTLASSLRTYDPLDPAAAGSAERYERFRRHAVATRRAVDRIAALARIGPRDRLAAAALLHDAGRLVVAAIYPHHADWTDLRLSPEERVRRERHDLGIDHALVGSVLVRRLGFPAPVAAAIEHHHSATPAGDAAVIQLADLVVHQTGGDGVRPLTLIAAADRLGIDRDRLLELLYDFPHGGAVRRRAAGPSPLSARETDALRGLAAGLAYKQIALDLSLSVSTIRTHLHTAYRKLGTHDRAQAVLLAKEEGWI